jgi:hypothetical protein
MFSSNTTVVALQKPETKKLKEFYNQFGPESAQALVPSPNLALATHLPPGCRQSRLWSVNGI